MIACIHALVEDTRDQDPIRLLAIEDRVPAMVEPMVPDPDVVDRTTKLRELLE